MKAKEFILSCIFFFGIATVFFYQVILRGYIPFPGDLLISEYNPWKAYSYIGYNPGSYPNKAQYFDTLRQIYPWKSFSITSLKSGEIPFWNPYNFSGAPLFANGQSAVFYPLNIFYFILPQQIAWALLIMSQAILSGIFFYLYVRELQISKKSAYLSAIAFSYCLFTSTFLEYNTIVHVFLWLPLALFCVEKLTKQWSGWASLLFVFSLVCSSLAGHIQIFGFVILFVTVYILYKVLSYKKTFNNLLRIIPFFFCILLSLGIAAPQLFSTFELIRLSARAPQEYEFLVKNLLLQPIQIILFLIPDFFGNPATRNYLLTDAYPGNAVYIGIAPFVFALFGVISFKENSSVRFFGIFVLIMLIFMIRSPFTELFYRLDIPFFSTGSPTNAIFLISFCLAVLCGFGFDKFLQKRTRTQLSMIILLFFFVVLMLGTAKVINSPMNLKNVLFSLVLFGTFTVLFFGSRFLVAKKTVVWIVFLSFTVVDLFYFFQKFNPIVPQTVIFPQSGIISYLQQNTGFERIWGYKSAAIDANFQTQFQLFSPEGYDPLYPKRYGEFVQSAKDAKIHTEFNNSTRSDAVVGVGSKDLSVDLPRLRVLDTLGVSYFVDRFENASSEKTFSPDRFERVYNQDGWSVYKNKYSARVVLATQYKIFQTNAEFEQTFFDPSFDPQKTILLEEQPGISIGNDDSEKKVTLLSYKPLEVRFQTTSNVNTLLYLSDVFFPGWVVTIDDKPDKLLRANYAFRAVAIPKGEHTVIFRYYPTDFSFAMLLSIISVGLLTGFSLLYRTKK